MGGPLSVWNSSQHALEKVGPPSEEREPSCYLGNGINTIGPVKVWMSDLR